MPLDGITLGAVARELNQILTGGRVDKVQQPEQDEILLTIRAGGANHRLLCSASANYARVHITNAPRKNPDTPPMFCMLLRKHLGGARVTGVVQVGSDRIIEIHFDGLDEMGDVAHRRLIAEIMGRHSNLMLVGDGRILACARHVSADISRVREVLPGLPYEAPPAQDKLDPLTADPSDLALRLGALAGSSLRKALQQSLYGLSPQAAGELAFRLTGDEDASVPTDQADEIARRTLDFLQSLPGQTVPTLYFKEDGVPADITSFIYLSREPQRQETRESLSHALDEFYLKRDNAERIRQKSATLRRLVQTALERCEKKLAIQMDTLRDTQNMDEMRKRGDLLTAFMHQIPRGSSQAQVDDYFDPEMGKVTIPLDPAISPQENAQRYYKQYAKRRAASKLVEGQIAENQEEINYLSGQMANLDNCMDLSDLEEIRSELVQEGYIRANTADKKKKQTAESKPLQFMSSDGIEIFVGKNNAQNDRLTQYADGNDTWLHAKDIPGSHVIIRHAAPPNQTLSQAAGLAAYYSRARESGLVPVDITLRKYVKKPKGSKPGFVIYSQQRTVYVPPSPTIESKSTP